MSAPARRPRPPRSRPRRHRRQVHRRRHQSAGPDEAADRDAAPPDRRQRIGAGQDREATRRAACGSAPWCATPTWPPTSACDATMACCRAPCWPALRASCATRPRRPATCCSGRDAPISTTPTCPATNASPARAVRRSAASPAAHAVLGTSETCIATHPSDMAVAMRASTPPWKPWARRRRPEPFAIADFHRLPGTTPHVETNLAPGELITAVTLPKPVGGTHIYHKVRDRASYAFALISVAADHPQGRLGPGGPGRGRPQALAGRERPKPPCRAAPRPSPSPCWPAPRPPPKTVSS
jgi:hypothetical protein